MVGTFNQSVPESWPLIHVSFPQGNLWINAWTNYGFHRNFEDPIVLRCLVNAWLSFPEILTTKWNIYR